MAELNEGFDTPITVSGPLRSPAQLLGDQSYDGHASVHDGDTAASIGLSGAPIEAPTHFSQFDPLAVAIWGTEWFEHGCISGHFQTMVVEGEEVQASMTTIGPRRRASRRISPTAARCSPGTASVGPDHPETELEARLHRLGDPGELFIVDQLQVGMRQRQERPVSMTQDERNGALYPFSLAEKLECITERHDWYTPDGADSSPWRRAVVPIEMISVLAQKGRPELPVRGPSLGLFLDLEVRLDRGAGLRRPGVRRRARDPRARSEPPHGELLDA